MKKTVQQLVIAYYSVYIAAIMAAVSGYFILKAGIRIDPLSDTGTTLNTLLIILIIGSMPVALASFNRYLKKLQLLDDMELKLKKYRKAGLFRILVIGIGLVLGVLFFYIMGLQSMIFSAGIAAIALFFCKPSEAKITIDLQLDTQE
jgi:hypothetical protein